MKRLWMLYLLGFVLLPVTAQETLPKDFEQWTAAALKGMRQELSTEAGKSANHLALRRLADFPNDLFLLAHREADGQPEWHETQVDVFVVQSGSATLLVGGTMVGAETTEPHEKRNGTIQGGVRRKMSAGDIIRIPAKTPHQVLLDGSPEFTYFVVKVKGY
ncbi:MAG TPA: cupin domain-containing protein [Candidatus Acidoferrum sp.]